MSHVAHKGDCERAVTRDSRVDREEFRRRRTRQARAGELVAVRLFPSLIKYISRKTTSWRMDPRT
jgi:hypothetical protein